MSKESTKGENLYNTKGENLYNTNHKTATKIFRDKHDSIAWSDQANPHLKIVKAKLNYTKYLYK